MNVNGSLKMMCFCAVLLSSYTANAGVFSFTGNFTNYDDLQLFDFTVSEESTVVMRTYGWGGGTNAAGDVIAAGGFDPVLYLFDAAGSALIDANDDGVDEWGGQEDDGDAYDSGFQVELSPGSYKLALVEVGASYDGGGLDGFTWSYGDYENPGRSDFWAVDILNVDDAIAVGGAVGGAGGGAGGEPIPEPGTPALMGLGAAAAGVAKRRRQKRAAA